MTENRQTMASNARLTAAMVLLAAIAALGTPAVLTLDSIAGQAGDVSDTISVHYTFTDAENDSNEIICVYYGTDTAQSWISIPLTSVVANPMRYPGSYSFDWASKDQLNEQNLAAVFLRARIGDANGAWATGAVISSSRSNMGAGTVDGKLFVVGGYETGPMAVSTVERYDPSVGSWVVVNPLSGPRHSLGVASVGGKLYAIGGYNDYSGELYESTVEEYDPQSGLWTTKTAMPTPRSHLTVGVADGKIYAVGGYNGSLLSSVEEYNPATDEWAAKTSMPTARDWAQIGVLDGKLYAIGGGSGASQTKVEVYDPATDQWVTKNPLAQGRYNHAVGVVYGKLFLLGGYDTPGGPSTSVEEYDPEADEWTAKDTMSTSRDRFAVGTIDDTLYAVGGADGGGGRLGMTEAYCPSTVSNFAVTGPFSIDNTLSPVCSLTAIAGEQTDSVVINFTLRDDEYDTLSILCEYSTDGNSWSVATVDGAVSDVDSSLYADSVIWLSSIDLADQDVDSLRFRITPLDSDTGGADTIIFHLDNYHSQSISVMTPSGEQNGDVTISYAVADPTSDSITLQCSYTYAGSGAWWTARVAGDTVVGPDGYSGSITWHSDSDMVELEETDVWFRIDVHDGIGYGSSDSTDNFLVDNLSNHPAVLTLDSVGGQAAELSDTLTIHFSFTDEENGPQRIEEILYSVDDTSSWQLVPTTSLDGNGYQSPGSRFVNWASRDQFGGADHSLMYLKTRLADSSGDSWSTMTSMSAARGYLAAGVIGGKLYAVGGNGGTDFSTLEEYDPSSDQWTTKASMPTARNGLAVGVIGGKFYAVGGWNGSYRATVEEYDPSTNLWATKAPMPTARAYFCIGVVGDKLYAVGGHSGDFLATVEEYDPSSDQWTTKTSMPAARGYLAAGVIDGKLYAVGGSNGNYQATVEEYDPASDQWTSKTSLTTAREHPAAGVIGSRLYVVGGSNGSALSSVEEYDPATDQWTARSPIPTARYVHAIGVIGSRLYAAGGYSAGYLAVLEEYTPLKYSTPAISQAFHLDNNIPPSCSLSTPSATQSGTAAIPCSLSDGEDDALSIVCVFSDDGGATWQAATMAGEQAGITSAHYADTLIWNTTADLGNTNQDDIKFAVVPMDNDTGLADTIGPFTVNNEHSPLLTIDSVGVAAGCTDLTDTLLVWFTTSDPDGSYMTTANWEFSRDGIDWLSIDQLQIQGNSSRAGGSYSITWLAGSGLNNLDGVDDSTVWVRMQAYDGAFYSGTASEAFAVDINSPPLVSIDTVAGENVDSVLISFQVSDEEADTADLTYSYSTDRGSSWSDATVRPALAATRGAFSGVIFEYYEAGYISYLPDYDALSAVHTDTLSNFDISPAEVYQTEYFGVRFRGYIRVPDSGSYTFYTTSDDGSALYIDDELVVNNDGTHGAQEAEGTLDLSAGLHSIEVPYFQYSSSRELTVQWEGPSFGKDTIPDDVLIASFRSDTTYWQSGQDLTSGIDNDDIWVRVIASDVDAGSGDTLKGIHVDLNDPPAIQLIDIYTPQAGDIPIAYTLVDSEYDDVSLVCWYSPDGGTSWSAATVGGQAEGIDSSGYSGSIIWYSGNDLPDTNLTTVQFRIAPLDNDTGTDDETINFQITNTALPSVDTVWASDSVLDGTITIFYRLADNENDNLGIRCMYRGTGLGGSSWAPASVTGDTTGIASANYQGSIEWHTDQDLDGHDGYAAFGVYPFDANGTGQGGTVSDMYCDYNDPPSVVVATPSGEQSGDIAIDYTLSDSEFDNVGIILEYSVDGGENWDTATVPASVGYIADIDSAEYAGTLTWFSGTDFANDSSATVMFRITPLDSDTGTSGSSGAFVVDNLTDHPAALVLDSVVAPGGCATRHH